MTKKTGPEREKSPRPLRKRITYVFRQALSTILFFAVLILILGAILWREVIVTVPPGSVGVHWYRFFGGTVTDWHYGEGLKVIFPWDKVYIYNARAERLDINVDVLSKEGVKLKVELTLNTIINPENVGFLHKSIGPKYIEKIIEPAVNSTVRERFSGYDPDQIYNPLSNAVEDQIENDINDRLADTVLNYAVKQTLISVSQTNLRTVFLPQSVMSAVEDKLRAEQDALRYQYVLERERLESERKAVEAEGVRRFQEIVTPAISEEYLRWRGIDATLQLALSPNSKVVVIGGGKDGLPLILDGATRNGPEGAAHSSIPKGADATEDEAARASMPPLLSGSQPTFAFEGQGDTLSPASPPEPHLGVKTTPVSPQSLP